MSKVKLVMMTCVAALALSALAAASASAAEGWMVNGAQLSGSKALATSAVTDEPAKLTAAGVTIECTGPLNGTNPEIKASNTGAATKLEFTTCSANETCTVTKSIGTVPIKAVASLLAGTAVKAVFEPQTKTIFATIKFEGETCALLGLQPVTGKATVTGPTGQTESVTQLIEASVGSGELKVGSSAATLKGSALLKLQSGEKWSFL